MSTSMSDSETISTRCASAEDGRQGRRLFWAGQTPSDFDSNSSPRFPQNGLSEYIIPQKMTPHVWLSVRGNQGTV